MSIRSGAVLVAALAVALMACGPPAVGSVGAVLGRDRETGALHVREAPEGLAAAEAGLLPGDQIKMIDGVLVDELDQTRIRAMLRGEVGTKVRLTILRGDEVLHVELVRRAMGAAPPPADPEERFEP
jgi:carboxyl-terminal processing protease